MNELKPEDVMKENDFLVRGISKEQLAEERVQALREGYHAILRKNDALIAKLEAYIDTLNDDKANLVEQINEKDAEIERLKTEVKRYENTCGKLIVRDNGEVVGFIEGQEKTYIDKSIARVLRSMAVTTARSEAITEFAEMLCEGRLDNDPVVIAVEVAVKEMREDQNDD